MSSRLGSLALLSALGACGDSTTTTTWVDVTFEAEPCSRDLATTLAIEIRDTDGVVVGTIEHPLVGSSAFPVAVRVHPENGDATRTWTVTGTLEMANGVALSVRTAQGGYVANEGTTETFTFEDGCIGLVCAAGLMCAGGTCVPPDEVASHPPIAVAECPAVIWVDAAAGDDAADCESPATPCATIQPTLNRYGMVATRGVVMHVAGGTYRGGDATTIVRLGNAVAGREGARRIVRAWPGMGTPIVEGSGSQFGVVMGAFAVVDGLEIRGAVQHGVSVNGSDIHDAIIQRLDVHGCGAGPSDFDNRAGIGLNNAPANIMILDSVFRENRSMQDGETARGMYANNASGIAIWGCSFVDNQGSGIRIQQSSNVAIHETLLARNGVGGARADDTAPFTVRDLIACTNEEDGIVVTGSSSIDFARVSAIDNDFDGIRVVSPVESARVFDNLLVRNRRSGVRSEGGVVLDDGYNLYFENVAGSVFGFTPARPETDLDGVDPEVASPCNPALSATSPARGQASDGGDLGSRWLP